MTKKLLMRKWQKTKRLSLSLIASLKTFIHKNLSQLWIVVPTVD